MNDIETLNANIKGLKDTENIEALKNFTVEKLNTYPIGQYKDLKAAKADRAEVNKGLKMVQDARKEYTRQYLEAVESNIDSLKYIEKSMKDVSDIIGVDVKRLEYPGRLARYEALKNYLVMVLECPLPCIDTLIAKTDKVMNKSTPIEEASELLRNKLETVCKEYETLTNNVSKSIYLETLDIELAKPYEGIKWTTVNSEFGSWSSNFVKMRETMGANSAIIDDTKLKEREELSHSLVNDLLGGL